MAGVRLLLETSWFSIPFSLVSRAKKRGGRPAGFAMRRDDAFL